MTMKTIEKQHEASVSLPYETIESLKNEFNISDSEVKSMLTAIINQAIKEHVGTSDSKVFTQAECLEMEEDLKGLGYI